MDLEGDQYDKTVNAIYETVTLAQAWHDAYAAIAGLTGARAVRITLVDKRHNPDSFRHDVAHQQNTNYYREPGYPPPETAIESFARFELERESADAGAITATGDVAGYVLSRDILDTGELRIMLACEFLSESEVRSRSVERSLDRLVPHLARAAQLQVAFAGVPFFDEWRQPAMLVALNGTVLRFNGATAQLLELTALIQVADGVLALQGGQQRRILDECRSMASEAPVYRMLRLTETDAASGERGKSTGQGSLYVFYHPVAVNRGHAALLTFYHPDSPPVVDAGLLATAFDLTPAQSRVACYIAEGRTPKEIAGKLGVQHDTVRKQLQAIYQKTSTNRQVDLIRLLLNLPAAL
jgi:DNA-binding CsgD family transcriptional regulator